ncbi:iron dependent repressor, metal binding and dimerization domain protein [Sporobacter termitidis]|uniref:iron dependent repressor, metal binding and dimerization domain protein n=1 Tax=Sporobacter termitidis TaxID=44749 RepID=UPI0009FFC045
MLGVNHEAAESDACAIEHVVSVETLCSLCRFTNRKCKGSCYVKTNATPNRFANSYIL